MQKKILIVDDEEKILSVVSSYLGKVGYFVITALSGKEALKIMQMHEFSLIILDLMLPDISGEELCKMIRKKSRVPIIMLTAKVEEDNVLEGFKLGTDDYITKPFNLRELTARIEAIFKRTENEAVPLSNILCFNNNELVINTATREVKKMDRILKLTSKEYKILLTLISYPNRVFSRDEIIKYSFNNEYESSDRSIDQHIKNLRQKIESTPNNPKFIHTIHGAGYCFKGE